ncbi:MAG: ACP S-malonyltransferase [Chloroflexi bacterium]|nr:ACP S-malonyltransferase [Chloroflexota bacterium]
MAPERARVAFVFPGQGSQAPAMGRSLRESSAAARKVWQAADASYGASLSGLTGAGSPEDLQPTDVQQPAIVAASVAALAAFNEVLSVHGAAVTASGYPLHVAALAGHSVGLVSAAVAAGCTPVGEAVALVRDRGRFMASAAFEKPGRMAAVLGLDERAVENLAAAIRAETPGSYLAVANVNAPQQVVVAGDLAAIDRIVTEGRKAGARRVIPLSVSGAFHSVAMLPAQAAMRERLLAIGIDPPAAPVISNIDAGQLFDPSAIRAELANHIAAPVRWLDGIRTIEALGVRHIVEFGHGSVLTGMLRRTVKDIGLHNVSDMASARATAAALTNG